ncbi:hypothetical protein K437DRAFT_292798 [Tilletiaria anomala UBC 951]|uniref:SEC7 domain-containing protein n=1 Tax=Tilletiaria anomala (strain ATCC 24038 / CBS 436.72 / UBC 951) TaxID=1037660 RepID=A0A066WJD7_TILAU|nr:uncharacterized protein K437DRAFT_292798 [Tilletiaria anomala UBC 951]KDN52673.1 hypothetical protein K437DRAFT_292798 [Tilletiaria anomala UBC 951]
MTRNPQAFAWKMATTSPTDWSATPTQDRPALPPVPDPEAQDDGAEQQLEHNVSIAEPSQQAEIDHSVEQLPSQAEEKEQHLAGSSDSIQLADGPADNTSQQPAISSEGPQAGGVEGVLPSIPEDKPMPPAPAIDVQSTVTNGPPGPAEANAYHSRTESLGGSGNTPAASAAMLSRTTSSLHSTSNRSSASISTSAVHSRSSLSSLTKGSAVFVITALESIEKSKEARKSKELKAACTSALEMVKTASASAASSTGMVPGPGGGGTAEAILDPRTVFEPLRLACTTGSTSIVITAVDCISKLVSYAFFAEDYPPRASQQPALADVVTDTICNAFMEGSDDKAQLQIIKALLSIVLSSSIHVHQGSLLKAVRTVYNIFLLSKSPANQAVAQGSLTQMVHHVFGRVPRGGVSAGNNADGTPAESVSPSRHGRNGTRSSSIVSTVGEAALFDQKQEEAKPHAGGASPMTKASDLPVAGSEQGIASNADEAEAPEESEIPLNDEEIPAPVAPPKDIAEETRLSAMDDTQTAQEAPQTEATEEKVTLQSLERRKSFEGASEDATAASLGNISQHELLVKDAFLVLRALCKLSMKPLGAESERDLRSHGMRSKLLSLHLILTILKSHMQVFQDSSIVIHSSSTGEQTAFVQAVKQYVCLSLSRNAVSSVNQIFELACEIFWLVMSGIRAKMKKEIEVLLNEIFLPILEMRNSTAKQKSILLNVLIRLCRDPRALVEVYINYDCDRTALENIYERLMNIASRISQTHVGPGSTLSAPEPLSPVAQRTDESGLSFLPTLGSSSSAAAGEQDPASASQPVEVRLKRQSLECLCSVLRSLVLWSSRNGIPAEGSSSQGDLSGYPVGLSAAPAENGSPRASEEARYPDTPHEGQRSMGDMGSPSGAATPLAPSTPDPGRLSMSVEQAQDDPSRFESAKQRKNTLLEGIRKFNQKPKRGIDFLVQHGFIRSRDPRDISRFLLYADGLNKAQIGEYLGEGEPENIATMHAFVDLMNFERMHFLAALRKFLQAFRLPGEAQKIDRYMLKFAERYVAGNPNVFANADTAYVFAYSIIMLNTDAHNPQVKHRMTLQDFIRNNAGIDDGKDLAEEYLAEVYEDILHNEIKMKDEVLASSGQAATSTGLANAIAGVGRDLQREAYELQSEGMANKTEALFRTMVRAQRRVAPQQRAAAERFFSASHIDHVKPMFEVAWMPFLAGISGPMQDNDDMDVVELCLQGFRDAIHIVCLFGLELERNAFVTTLAKFTFLNNLGEMKAKNIEAIKTLLGIAQTEGNYLKGSWRELLTCVSQLERFQLLSGGVDEKSLPDLGRRKVNGATPSGKQAQLAPKAKQALPTNEVVQAGGSTEVTVAADMVFSSTPSLTGSAIVDFVQALSEVSWEEIQSSGMTDSPRLFSLQKLVEISYYNMERIRMEWSHIWAILGEHFNQVLVTSSPSVSAFSVDALRQLSMRFLEKEELPRFAFQKDFLRPFAYAMAHSPEIETREMIIDCLWQMVQARSANLRSGWTSLFVILTAASKDSSERVCAQAFDLTQSLFESHFPEILRHGFADFTVCLTSFSKCKAQRISLQAIAVLRGLVPAMLRLSDVPGHFPSSLTAAHATEGEHPAHDALVQFWFPCLFAFYDIVMNGDDLEVRRVALDSLFDILKKHGHTFRPDFWDTICQEVLFPIFSVLRSRNDVSRFSTHEDMSVWLSTTMIHALRNLVDLWTFYFDTLERLLPGLLELLCACICQENDTLARIGTSCLQQLIEKNVTRLNNLRWSQVVDTFMQLFRTTTAHQLFDPSLRAGGAAVPSRPGTPEEQQRANGFSTPRPLSPGVRPDGASGAQLLPPVAMSSTDRRRVFKQIIVKCVLQLLLIDTTNELLHNDWVYERVPPDQLLRLLNTLQDSYDFSKRFNADKDLRMALWKVGFMKQLPNLLKQESSSASTLVAILVKMHEDPRATHVAARVAIRKRFVPLAEEVVLSYIPLDPETQARNIIAWTPVVSDVFRGVFSFNDSNPAKESHGAAQWDAEPEQWNEENATFSYYAPVFYPLAVELIGKEPLASEVVITLKSFLWKVGMAKGLYGGPDGEQRRRRERAQEREQGRSSSNLDNPLRIPPWPRVAKASNGNADESAASANASDALSQSLLNAGSHSQGAATGDSATTAGPHRPQPLSIIPHVVNVPEVESATVSAPLTSEKEAAPEVVAQGDDDGHMRERVQGGSAEQADREATMATAPQDLVDLS